MSIWKISPTPSIEIINSMVKDTAVSTLGIEFTEMGDDFLRATMPVDPRTVQPHRILHGGASVLLAESIGSQASYMCVDASQFRCVGLDINANHVRGVSSGKVIGTARPVHLGRTTHVWEIRIETEDGKLVCISRLTMAIIPA
jgi:1,4-dihydroxy-2-naphthoyl-CoA hydrolase